MSKIRNVFQEEIAAVSSKKDEAGCCLLGSLYKKTFSITYSFNNQRYISDREI